DVRTLAIIPRHVTRGVGVGSGGDSTELSDKKGGAHNASSSTHTHTVVKRYLLISGGVDTQFAVYNIERFTLDRPLKILPFPHRSLISLSKPTRTFMMHHNRTIDVS